MFLVNRCQRSKNSIPLKRILYIYFIKLKFFIKFQTYFFETTEKSRKKIPDMVKNTNNKFVELKNRRNFEVN